MAVGPHPRTAEAGLEILRAGGNAFDAAVAAAFTEAVVQPAHNGVAGYGGAMVGYEAAAGRVVCVDYNSEAPAAARPDMFPIEPCEATVYAVPGLIHRHGALSVGVPGVVAGLDAIHRGWGTLPLARLLEPAIRAARDGWLCNTATHNCFIEHGAAMAAEFPEAAALLMPGGRIPQPGDRLANPDLARTLECFTAVGLRDFYEGEIAVRTVQSLRRQGGILTLEDLAGYQARHVTPLALEYRGRTLHTPPVGCGGMTSFQLLRVLEGFDLADRPPASAAFFHLFLEAMKACWQRRLRMLGDPDFTGVPESSQLEPALIEELRQEVGAGLAGPQPGTKFAPEPSKCTSHLCTADAAGNVVSLTQTHGAAFGSWVTARGTGLVFGHGLARFDPRSGWPNSIAPGKRPLHNMAPVLVIRDGRPAAAYGTPGGRTIVNNQAYFTLLLYDYGLTVAEAMALPRLHCEEAEPCELEPGAGEAVFEGLRALGHQVNPREQIGGPAHGILVGDAATELDGATDPRYEGLVAAA